MRAEGVVDGGSAPAEIAHRLYLAGNGGNHAVGFSVAKPFVVEEKECLAMPDGPAQRCAEIVLD